MNTEKSISWKELKDFANSLPEEELSKAVVWMGEERGGRIGLAECMDEDYVQTDYGVEPASVQEYEEGDEHYPTIYKKGTPILYTDIFDETPDAG
jgi:hypothetical protein